MFRLISECGPAIVFGEQVASSDVVGSAGKSKRPVEKAVAAVDGKPVEVWIDGVCADLASEGYASGFTVLGAHSVAAPHKRLRVFWVAESGDAKCRWWDQPGREHGRALHAANGGGVDILADAGFVGFRSDGHGSADGTSRGMQRADGERQRVRVDAGAGGGMSCPLAHPASDGRPEYVREPGNGSRRGAGPGNTTERGGAGRMADTESGGQRIDGGSSRDAGHAPLRRDAVALEHASGCGRRPQGDASQPPAGIDWERGACAMAQPNGGCADSRQQRQQPCDGGSNAVADTEHPIAGPGDARIQGQPGSGRDRPAIGRTTGPWSNAIPLACLDGKSRRFEPGIFPLVNGIPHKRSDPRLVALVAGLEGMGHGAKAARGIIKRAKANRVGRLKGSGNAIVPQVAAEFIRAWIETSGDAS